jgi:NAD(P)-dependent dehydrogenase (short-subunit alcohol dehydrogenase family)
MVIAMNNGTSGRRVCLLTGAGGRLGTAFCHMYASQYDIIAVYRSRPPLTASQSQRLIDPLQPGKALSENDHPVYAVQADLATDEGVARAVDIALARHDRVDLLVNAAVNVTAGSMIDSDKVLDTADAVLRLNVTVPLALSVRLARLFWRERKDENVARNRNVVNVSSVSATNVYPNTGHSMYSASKAALNHLTRYMALEFADIGVRVNALAPTSFPALIRTERVAQGIEELDKGNTNGAVLILDVGRPASAR